MPRCRISGEEFQIPQQSRRIYEQFGYPEPSISFIEAMRQLSAYRNYTTLFKRKCDLSGASILSTISPKPPFKVYEKELWIGDSWDALDYGREFNSAEPFFSQFNELLKAVPFPSLQNIKSENADYCNAVEGVKDCYLAFVAMFDSSDVYCSFFSMFARNIYYSTYTRHGELLFYCSQLSNCYECVGCEECMGCFDCTFSFLLDSCNHCIFCSNLHRKEYHIFNQPVSRKDYERFLEQLRLGTLSGLRSSAAKFAEVKQGAVYREALSVNTENSFGNHINGARSCPNAFVVENVERTADAIFSNSSNDTYRAFGVGGGSSFCYHCSGMNGATDITFSINCYYSHNCHYCINTYNCRDCFGCAGLRQKHYCIFNREYSEQEYHSLRDKIIAHMRQTPLEDKSCSTRIVEYGAFFPPQYSPYAFNDSLADVFFPLPKDEALRRGYGWSEDEETLNTRTAPIDVPGNIEDWTESLSSQPLRCSISNKPFLVPAKIITQFKQKGLAIIDEHPMVFLKRRLGEDCYRLMERSSTKSGKAMKTVYPPETAPRILTNEEYLAEFFQ